MRGEFLDIVTVITDSGTQHYSETYLNETWIANNFYRHGGMKVNEFTLKLLVINRC